MSELILEDWSEYDNKKVRGPQDARFFSCEEKWEVDYLINKIQKTYPFYEFEDIVQAIKGCCATVRAPRPRKVFVECVMEKLENKYFKTS